MSGLKPDYPSSCVVLPGQVLPSLSLPAHKREAAKAISARADSQTRKTQHSRQGLPLERRGRARGKALAGVGALVTQCGTTHCRYVMIPWTISMTRCSGAVELCGAPTPKPSLPGGWERRGHYYRSWYIEGAVGSGGLLGVGVGSPIWEAEAGGLCYGTLLKTSGHPSPACVSYLALCWRRWPGRLNHKCTLITSPLRPSNCSPSVHPQHTIVAMQFAPHHCHTTNAKCCARHA